MGIFLKKFEKVVIISLIVMLAVVIVLSIIELGWIILKDIIKPPIILLEISELLEIFGFFLLILIGVELLEITKIYLVEKAIHVEIVLEVALIAISRKVIILEHKELQNLNLLGIAAIIVALASAAYLRRLISNKKS